MPVNVIILEADALALAARYRSAAPVVRQLIADGMDQENDLTLNHIKLTKFTLAGPRYLNVRTGKARQSVARVPARIEGAKVTSSIGSNIRYVRAHEFGFKGTEKVRSFIRKVKGRDRRAVGKRGKPLKNGKLLASGITQVRAHDRKVNIRERSMIRDGINERIRSGAYGLTISRLIRKNFGR